MYKLCNWLPFYRPYSFASQPFSCFALCSCIWLLYNSPSPRVNAVLSLFVSGYSILRLPLRGDSPHCGEMSRSDRGGSGA